MKIMAGLALLFGVALCIAAYVTWGVNNHMIGFPYKAFAVAGVALLLLGAWMLKS
jgi:hypothetical protein